MTRNVVQTTAIEVEAGEIGRDGRSDRARFAERCDHGGAFFDAIGDQFDDLSRRAGVINADVLDAWFPPAPSVREAIVEHADWMMQTSPPTHGAGLTRAIAAARGVPVESIVLGAGSSALIFMAFQRWLTARSRALVLDPMYAEYAHVLEQVLGCRVERFALEAAEDFVVDLNRLAARCDEGFDLVAIVNPNNPTGRLIPREELLRFVDRVPASTQVWIDEAYIDYAGREHSVEMEAVSSGRLIVCKSLSKVYALSGARVAYLVAPRAVAEDLRRITPPWAVSLPAQVAAVRAMGESAYYRECYAKTAELRAELEQGLSALGMKTWAGALNCVLCRLPECAPVGARVVELCRDGGVYIRDCGTISGLLAERYVRVAVRDAESNARTLRAIRRAMDGSG